MDYKIIAIKINEIQDISDVIKKIWDYLFKNKSGDIVVIKPNYGHTELFPAVVTNPVVLLETVKILRDKFNRVIIGESNLPRYNIYQVLKNTPLLKAIKKVGGEFINFSDDKWVETKGKFSRFKFPLPKTLMDADFKVNIPVIKTHELTYFTCSIKNLFGCIPRNDRIVYHRRIHEILMDLYDAIKPDFTLADGTICMDGNGPIHGNLREEGILIGGTDSLAVDKFICDLINFDLENIPHINNLWKLRAGKIDVKIVGNVPKALSFIPKKLDIQAKVMINTFKSPQLSKLLYFTPIFSILEKLTWGIREILGIHKINEKVEIKSLKYWQEIG